ncbi:MAG: twin-arginine translocation signal domain-containing protein [Kiritimatiellae bacterium]|nr:twin-arginine translocation signal domain-containing protein [Kiritimatiellia bacterium]
MSKMDRRNFMQASIGAAGLAVAATAHSAMGSESPAKPTAVTGADCDVDVLVVGGGTVGEWRLRGRGSTTRYAATRLLIAREARRWSEWQVLSV